MWTWTAPACLSRPLCRPRGGAGGTPWTALSPGGQASRGCCPAPRVAGGSAHRGPPRNTWRRRPHRSSIWPPPRAAWSSTSVHLAGWPVSSGGRGGFAARRPRPEAWAELWTLWANEQTRPEQRMKKRPEPAGERRRGRQATTTQGPAGGAPGSRARTGPLAPRGPAEPLPCSLNMMPSAELEGPSSQPRPPASWEGAPRPWIRAGPQSTANQVEGQRFTPSGLEAGSRSEAVSRAALPPRLRGPVCLFPPGLPRSWLWPRSSDRCPRPHPRHSLRVGVQSPGFSEDAGQWVGPRSGTASP